jgi:hypothetical protein
MNFRSASVASDSKSLWLAFGNDTRNHPAVTGNENFLTFLNLTKKLGSGVVNGERIHHRTVSQRSRPVNSRQSGE